MPVQKVVCKREMEILGCREGLGFPPLAGESLTAASPACHDEPVFCDRGAPLSRLTDGTSNTILIMHTYALCGASGSPPLTGAAWGYTAGAGQNPSQTQGYQPWQRASYIRGQVYLNTAAQMPFQTQPNPYNSACSPTSPATPHSNSMLVSLGDASVRSVAPSISPDTWNKACLPNDGNPLPPDWQ